MSDEQSTTRITDEQETLEEMYERLRIEGLPEELHALVGEHHWNLLQFAPSYVEQQASAFVREVMRMSKNGTPSHSEQGTLPCSTLDAVSAYFQEIDAFPLLCAQEEARLAHAISQGDTSAKERLIEHNLRLVVHVAKGYQGLGLSLLDLIQEGNLGLMRAADTFDPERGRFSTYAVCWIRQQISRALDNTARPIRLPSYRVDQVSRIARTAQSLFEVQGHDPDTAEIARAVHLDTPTVSHLRLMSLPLISLDTPVRANEPFTLMETLPDVSLPEHDQAFIELETQREQRRSIADLLSLLTLREQEVIRLHFGLDGQPIHTLADIGRKLGLSRERVRQINDAALHKLRTVAHGTAFEEAIEQKQAS
jgi:RNA polymerase primary sigma factor